MRTISSLLAAAVVFGGVATANADFMVTATDITATALTGAATTPNGKLVAAGFKAYKLTVTGTNSISGIDLKNGVGYGITSSINQKWNVVPTIDTATGEVLSNTNQATPSGTAFAGADSYMTVVFSGLALDAKFENNSLSGSPVPNVASGSTYDAENDVYAPKNGSAYGLGTTLTASGTFFAPLPSSIDLAYLVVAPGATIHVVGGFTDAQAVKTVVDQTLLSPPIPEPASLGLLALGALGLLGKRRAAK